MLAPPIGASRLRAGVEGRAGRNGWGSRAVVSELRVQKKDPPSGGSFSFNGSAYLAALFMSWSETSINAE